MGLSRGLIDVVCIQKVPCNTSHVTRRIVLLESHSGLALMNGITSIAIMSSVLTAVTYQRRELTLYDCDRYFHSTPDIYRSPPPPSPPPPPPPPKKKKKKKKSLFHRHRRPHNIRFDVYTQGCDASRKNAYINLTP